MFLLSIFFSINSLFGVGDMKIATQTYPTVQMESSDGSTMSAEGGSVTASSQLGASEATETQKPALAASAGISSEGVTDNELLILSGNTYADGEIPLGDNKYTTTGPKKGYIYLCNAQSNEAGGGAGNDGPWIHGATWNFLQKTIVAGSVSWSNATFSNVINGAYRVLSGNGLPISHTTGSYPISRSDPAAAYDRNPNSISAQTIKDSLPVNPTYTAIPYCMGGEVGIMLSGVPLFNAFDATLRDAPAHELQDACGGHPQVSGQYHYHSLSACFKDVSVKTVLGYALDGFPITGPQVAKERYLTTEDLDACHGLTSEVLMDGKKKVTYHYVMTQDYPYSVSCFRGKPIRTGPASTSLSAGGMVQQSALQGSDTTRPEPPQEAKDACIGKSSGSTCAVGGQMTGMCTPFDAYLACIPAR